MKFEKKVCLGIIILFVTCSILPIRTLAQEKITIRFMSGGMGGSQWVTGGALSELWQKNIPGLTISLIPGGGVANVMGIEQGKTDLGMGMSGTTIDGIYGRDPFKSPSKLVMNMGNLFPMLFQMSVLADSGIKTVADMKGKSICPAPRGHTSEYNSRMVLELYGLSYKDMSKVSHVNYADGAAMMKDGLVDIYSQTSTIPAAATLEIATARKIRLISLPDDIIEKIRKINPGNVKAKIPAGTYPGVDYDVNTFSVYTHILASSKVPESLVYRLTKVTAENIPRLHDVAQYLKGLTVQEMGMDIGIPFHPGALKYYKEVGVIK